MYASEMYSAAAFPAGREQKKEDLDAALSSNSN